MNSVLVDPASAAPEPRYHPPGDKVATSSTTFATASINARATATAAAGTTGVQHVATSCTFSLASVAQIAVATIGIAIWDGATGSTMLWGAIIAVSSQGMAPVTTPPLSAIGSAATVMTADFSAGVTGATQFVSLAFHDIGI